MRILSLLPSATEIVYALGLGDDLVGVTAECDFPADATTKPVAVRSTLPQGRPLSAGETDALVRERVDARSPLYALDRDLVRQLEPDLVLTQDLCRVCAVPTGDVREALAELGAADARVVSLDPGSLEDVLGTIATVAEATGTADRAALVIGSLRARIDAVRDAALRLPSVRMLCLEWSQPPFVSGHWVPELVEIAGATNVLNGKGEPSREVTWREIRDATPEIAVFMPCGYYLEEAEEEAADVLGNAEFAQTPAAREQALFAVDATSYFSRPGPRVVDGLEILAWVGHPDAFPAPPADAVVRVR